MLIVIDNVLSQEEQEKIQALFTLAPEARNMRWIDGAYDDVKNNPSPISKLLMLAGRTFDLSEMAGAEIWAHYGTRPDWHVDKDEKLYQMSGNLEHPICSIVYYAKVEELAGGMFMTETMNIMPVSNRAIIFAPKIMHGVQPYEGSRLSVAVNPWAAKPTGY
jgi:hypothetical protein